MITESIEDFNLRCFQLLSWLVLWGKVPAALEKILSLSFIALRSFMRIPGNESIDRSSFSVSGPIDHVNNRSFVMFVIISNETPSHFPSHYVSSSLANNLTANETRYFR